MSDILLRLICAFIFKFYFRLLLTKMSTTPKGWLGSKRRVLCGYCGTESRHDNLRRHTDSRHGKDTEVKFSVIEPKESILSLIHKQKTSSGNNNDQPGGDKDLVEQNVNDNVDPESFDTSVNNEAGGDVGWCVRS